MSINYVNNVGGVADRTIEVATPKQVSDNLSNYGEKKLDDSAKFDNEMFVTNHELTENFLQTTIDNANQQFLGSDREFSYSIHEKTGQFMVKIVDKQTKEVIREIPPEKNLDVVAKLCELAGLFVDEKK